MSDAATQIVNAALVQLGEDPVTSVLADPAPSRLVKMLPHLDPALDAVLCKYGWLCALDYLTLEPSPDVAGNWAFPVAYVLPTGTLRLWEVDRADGWERATEMRQGQASRMILRAVGGGPVNVAVVMRRPADALDANVTDAVAMELAARACRSINGSVERALELRRLADQALLAAMGTDGQDAKRRSALVGDRVADLRRSAL